MKGNFGPSVAGQGTIAQIRPLTIMIDAKKVQVQTCEGPIKIHKNFIA
jgi:hypothetical protein